MHDWSKVRSVINMLFTYSDMIGEYGSAYRIGKAVDSGEVFEVVRGVLGDCFDCVGMNGSTDERRLGIAIDSAKINNLSEY